jgi:hypothetical protein
MLAAACCLLSARTLLAQLQRASQAGPAAHCPVPSHLQACSGQGTSLLHAALASGSLPTVRLLAAWAGPGALGKALGAAAAAGLQPLHHLACAPGSDALLQKLPRSCLGAQLLRQTCGRPAGCSPAQLPAASSDGRLCRVAGEALELCLARRLAGRRHRGCSKHCSGPTSKRGGTCQRRGRRCRKLLALGDGAVPLGTTLQGVPRRPRLRRPPAARLHCRGSWAARPSRMPRRPHLAARFSAASAPAGCPA